MTATAIATPPVLTAHHEPSWRRWALAALIVILVHAGIIFWLLYVRQANLEGAPPAVVEVELAPMDVAPPAPQTPDVMEGPEMQEATPDVAEEQQIIPVPELPLAVKPNVVMLPHKPKPKPKKLVKEVPKPVVKHDVPQPRTSAPKHSEAAHGPTSAARRGTAGSAASISTWRAQIIAQLLRHKPSGGAESGTVTVSFTLSRNGGLMGASLAGSSGSAVLDRKAMEMVHASNPFPAAPSDEKGGGPVRFTVPVRFHQ